MENELVPSIDLLESWEMEMAFHDQLHQEYVSMVAHASISDQIPYLQAYLFWHGDESFDNYLKWTDFFLSPHVQRVAYPSTDSTASNKADKIIMDTRQSCPNNTNFMLNQPKVILLVKKKKN